jgi:membrane associated rhomboid family serine protease
MLLPLLTSTKLHRFPVVVLVLVVVNSAAFLVTRDDVLGAANHWGFVPSAAEGRIMARSPGWDAAYTSVTYAFLHGGWCHLIGNMWMLLVFGMALESRAGHIPFAAAYLAFAILAVGVHAMMQTGAVRPAIGASGAISGVLGCYLALEPRSRVLSVFFLGIIFFLTEIPALFYAAVWLILQIDGIQTRLLTGPECRNIAWWAHLGGFASGMTLGILVEIVKRAREKAATAGP